VNTDTLVLIFVVVVILFAAGLGIWFASRTRRSKNLREKFGPEYDLSLEKEGSKRTAEEALKEREKRVTKLDVRDLNQNERDRYHTEWLEVQAQFVDDPSKALAKANLLITEVMLARGFPVADFEQRAADVSVLYPNFVTNYRSANAIAMKNQLNQASTEEMRQAMVSYRTLFDELLGTLDVTGQEKAGVTK
jgi:hypothetical protein